MNSRAQKVLTVIDAALHTGAQRVRAAVSSSPRRARKAANGPDNISAVIRAGNRFFSELTGEEISGQNLDEFMARLFTFWDAASEPHTGFSLCALTERHLKTGPLKNFSDCLPPLLAFFTSETAKLRGGVKSPAPARPARTAPAPASRPAPAPTPRAETSSPTPATHAPTARSGGKYPLSEKLAELNRQNPFGAGIFYMEHKTKLAAEAYEMRHDAGHQAKLQQVFRERIKLPLKPAPKTH